MTEKHDKNHRLFGKFHFPGFKIFCDFSFMFLVTAPRGWRARAGGFGGGGVGVGGDSGIPLLWGPWKG